MCIRDSDKLIEVKEEPSIHIDIDKDGDQDLFVGTRLIPQKYGLPSNGYILENDGEGNFINVTDSIAPELNKIGMITDASFIDYENDGDSDLLVVGHWMPIKLLEKKIGLELMVYFNRLIESNTSIDAHRLKFI